MPRCTASPTATRRPSSFRNELQRSEPSSGDVDRSDHHLGDRCSLGGELRPHIVWFGESVPAMEEAAELVAGADVLLVVGTSLVVHPAASLVFEARRSARRIVVNPEIPESVAGKGFEAVAKPATIGVPEVVAELLAGATGQGTQLVINAARTRAN